jgi:hypothetical protein
VVIDIVIVIVLLGVPYPPFISTGAAVTRKVRWPVTIVIQIGLYIQSFLITRFDLIRVWLHVWELCYHHIVVIWVYTDPHMGLPSHLGHIPWVRILITWPGRPMLGSCPACENNSDRDRWKPKGPREAARGGWMGAESNSFARINLCPKFKPQSQNPIRRWWTHQPMV